MNSDEHTLLSRFLNDLVAARGVQKDPEADQMINNALRGSPDAPYVLVQHAILSDQALHQAQQQIATLQDQLRQIAPAQAPAGFMPGGQQQQGGPWTQQGQYQPPPQQAGGFMGAGPFRSGGGLGSFFRNAGTMAAGVAGGSLLAEGLSGLFGGGRGGGFFGGGGFGGGGAPGEVVNNYYDDGGGSGGGDWGGGGGDWGGGDGGGGFDSGGGGDF